MMYTLNILALLASCIVSSFAQEQYHIQPDSVPIGTRDAWCESQLAQCPLICLQQPGVQTTTGVDNDCNADQLTYVCVCPNGVTPNISQYSLTLPYYICEEWGNQCVAACGDSTCASDCRQNHPCGAQDSSPPNKTIIAASKSRALAAATTQPGSTVHTGFADGTDTGGAAGIGMSANGGLMVVFGALFLGFAIGL